MACGGDTCRSFTLPVLERVFREKARSEVEGRMRGHFRCRLQSRLHSDYSSALLKDSINKERASRKDEEEGEEEEEEECGCNEATVVELNRILTHRVKNSGNFD
ncbi:hypothetical protein EYF80_054434 [Liparis tanakae]|uniref:Uncharacterized protein n=1 Tax=Liparis tanakae TaxID=230148 RepID=A0A4Z2F2X6_9TELE|nr:hypothetical protein EYF80_054434 [Liparis tanakae]